MATVFRIQLIEKERDYPTVEAWWRTHGWPPVAAAMLPLLGVMALKDGAPIAAGWAYMDNSTGVAMLEWLVADPAAKPREVLAGLGHVIDFLKAEVKANGYGAMLGTCQLPSLSRLLQRHGFTVTDSNMIHHVSIL